MKPLQLMHALVTLLLLVIILGFAVLTMTGIIQVSLATTGQIRERPFMENNGLATSNSGGTKAQLLVVRGAKLGMKYPIFQGQNVIGRADEKPVEIDLEFQETPERIWSSRQHAVITCEKDALFIEDLNSSNGTYVNRSRVPPGARRVLKENDIIQIGEVQLKVLMSS
jgi:hypothetical protein